MNKLNHGIFLVAVLLLAVCGSVNAASQERRQLFDFGWRFALGEHDGAAAPGFDDSSWRRIDLPHDWSIEGQFDREAPSGNDSGYLPTGTGWYRKAFDVPKDSKDKRISLYFEGVYMCSEVYVNGKQVGSWPYGYTSFSYDITPYINVGGRNVVAVRVDNSRQKNSRWYTGSGIYRHVWLVTTGQMHIDNWGVFVKSAPCNGGDGWKMDVDVSYTDGAQTGAKPEIRNVLYDADGKAVARSAGGQRSQTLIVKAPRLWSPDEPNLYTVKTMLVVAGKVVDEVETVTGFRHVTYDSANGLMLNGKPIELNGGCVHHDNGVLGARSYDAAEARKVKLLKDAGFNAVRTSHNIPSEAFLRECDRQGLLVIDEAFDGWRDAKTKYDYSVYFDEWWQRDVEAMVLRDRNHPSIFCWSIGNEVIERKKLEVVTTARKLAECVRSLDPTRPVTSALTTWDADWEIFDPLAAVHDIVGYNYQMHRVEADHRRVPSRVIMQTESYPRDAYANWLAVTENPYVVGDFVWTAIDYLGESGIGRYFYKGETEGEHYQRDQYPWHGAYCGDIDITGWRKPISHYRDMLYNEDKKLYMAVREPDGYYGEIKETQWGVWPTWESWNWSGHEGKPIDVEVYSRYPKVRLYLDGQLIGEQPTGKERQFKAVFAVDYRPGTLKALGIDDAGEARDTVTLSTAGKPFAVRLTPSASEIAADGQDLVYVTAEIVDRDGRVVPCADNKISFDVVGAGILEATGNADMKDPTPYVSAERKAWKGRALAVVRSGRRSGKIVLKATSPMLKAAKVTVTTHK